MLYTILITMTVLVSQGRPTTTYSPSSGATTEHRCKRHLRHHIEMCLEGFEQLLSVYRDVHTTNESRRSMVVNFCHEYEETLQCLHTVLQQCEPEMEHLNLIAHRVGYLREYMHETCYVKMDQAPIHGRHRTTPPPPTTRHDSRRPIGVAYEHVEYPERDNARSTLSNASDRKKYRYKNVDDYGRASELPALMNDEDHKNAIPLNLDDQQQNGVNIDTNMIHIKGPEDCNEMNSKTNAMCAMFLSSSASSLPASTALLLTLLTWVLVRL